MNMKTFEVICTGSITIAADSLAEANRYFANTYPQLSATHFFDEESGEAHEVIGYCEDSGLSIFDGDDYGFDSEGIMWLNGYSKE